MPPTCIVFALLLSLLLSAPLSAQGQADANELRAEGMTFTGTSGREREVVLRSRLAVLHADAGTALLTDVNAEVSVLDEGLSFTMICENAELDLVSNDFVARGKVRGETADGQNYRAPWVEYDHEAGVLSTDAPVVMEDRSGSFRGDGFRYYLREKRFQLLGNVRVEQAP